MQTHPAHNTCNVTSTQKPGFGAACPGTLHQADLQVHVQVKVCAETANVGKLCRQLVCINTFGSNHVVSSLVLSPHAGTAAKWIRSLSHCLAQSSDCRSDQAAGCLDTQICHESPACDHMLAVTGQRRQALDHFVVAFGVDTHSSSNGTASSSDPVLQVWSVRLCP